MPRDLFQPSHDDTPALRRAGIVPFSVAAHVAAIGAAVLVPALAVGALPDPRAAITYVTTEHAMPVVPPPGVPNRGRPPQSARGAPLVAPDTLPPLDAEPPDTSSAVIDGPDTGVGLIDGIPDGVVGGAAVMDLAPPPEPQRAVRVGGDIQPPVKVRDAAPAYPEIARAARVQGIVIIEATIGPDGAVKDAKVLRSIPLLDQAALDAVRQWVFTPTLLNGVPVPVIMTVTVQFTLQ